MLKVRFEYDLPDFDPEKHDPEKTFAFLIKKSVPNKLSVIIKNIIILCYEKTKMLSMFRIKVILNRHYQQYLFLLIRLI